VHNPYFANNRIFVVHLCCMNSMETTCIYIYIVQDCVVALLRFIGSISNLSLLTIGGYCYYNSHDKMMEGKMVTG
jgi:hypothetical protein